MASIAVIAAVIVAVIPLIKELPALSDSVGRREANYWNMFTGGGESLIDKGKKYIPGGSGS